MNTGKTPFSILIFQTLKLGSESCFKNTFAPIYEISRQEIVDKLLKMKDFVSFIVIYSILTPTL